MTGPIASPNQVEVDEGLVHQLLKSQMPEWSDLPIVRLPFWGTDNAMFRLGDEFTVRLPRVGWSRHAAAKEGAWLPRLAELLPLAIPRIVRLGRPSELYPWEWGVLEWLPGTTPDGYHLPDPRTAAETLGPFVAALQQVKLADGPPAGVQNGFRGSPLADRHQQTIDNMSIRAEWMEVTALFHAWELALRAPPWTGPPRWLHGDLHPGNLLLDGEAPTAVIDWGTLAVGDPACDLMIAWNLPKHERSVLRSFLDIDDATWLRGRGCALYQWIGGVHEDEPDNEARRVINRILADVD